MATSKIAKDIILENYSDNLGYTVGANTTRDIAFSMPTKTGYTLKQITCILNQNYTTCGVGLTGGNIHIALRNNLSSPLDVKITLQYLWERN